MRWSSFTQWPRRTWHSATKQNWILSSYQLAAQTKAHNWGDLTFLLNQKRVKSHVVPWLTFTTYAGVPGFGTSAVTWPLLRDRTVYIADIQSAGVWICTKPSHPSVISVSIHLSIDDPESKRNELLYSAIWFSTSFYFLKQNWLVSYSHWSRPYWFLGGIYLSALKMLKRTSL